MKKVLKLNEGISKMDLLLIFCGFCFCLFPILVLTIPTYTQSACETVEEGYQIYFERNKTPSYLEESNINVYNALKDNCPSLDIG